MDVLIQIPKGRLQTGQTRSTVLNCSTCVMGGDYVTLPWRLRKPTISATQTRPARVPARCQPALHYSQA